MLNYTDITQNTYIQSWTVTEIMAREKCGILHFRVMYASSAERIDREAVSVQGETVSAQVPPKAIR